MAFPRKLKRLGLFGQMTALMAIVLLVSLLLVTVFFSSIIDGMIERTTGEKALAAAELIAEHPDIIDAFADQNPAARIQPIAETLRKRTGADYVVIANTEGIRYSHPHENQIGQKTETSNKAPLAGKSTVFIGNGILGEAVKAKTPIFNREGDIIGVSSVGFLTTEIKDDILFYQLRVAGFGGLALLIGIPGALYIARRVKKLIFGLEPEEISRAFSEKQAILESVGDATLAVGPDLQILSANKRARVILGSHVDGELTEPQLQAFIKQAAENPEKITQQRLLIASTLYIVDAAPILAKHAAIGFVLTIRPFSEVEDLANELLEIKQHTEHMRAQTHEYLNKLNTLNGLLLLEKYEEAKAFMKAEVTELQETVTFLMASVKDPLIVAALLGKVNRAKEMKAALTFAEGSTWLDYPATIKSDHVVTVIGNLIDNALEAAVAHQGANAHVHIAFTDFGNDMIMDIEDNGKGMTPKEEAHYLQTGATSKSEGQHGLGLTIMQHALHQLHGTWFMAERPGGGMRMTIAIPKHKRL
ncbi:ATP-binding protein [Shouchella clausii]|uniref:ATP-binding protein n=1 Tax=Shouchella clausii TaxID=79880 RepID=UPI000BA6995B|nr:sensor histidine kinase [Shouchella clausii]PAD15671.1 histidine kinase [Shouchella clausii]